MARRGQGRRGNDRSGMLTSRLTNAPAPVVKPSAPAPVVTPKPVVKPPAPKPYADPAPVTPAPRAPVAPKTFTAPTPAPVAEVITDINADSTIEDTTATEGLPLPEYNGRLTAPTLLATPEQDSTYSALDNYSNFFKNTQGQSLVLAEAAKESKDFSGLKNVDINKLNQNVSKGLDEYSVKEVDNRIINYVKDNNIAPFIETEDGEKLFFTSGTDTSMPTIAAMGDAHQEDGRYISFGEVGTYSSKWVPNPSTAAEILNTPALNLAAMFVPGGTAVLSAVKGLSGMTLHASDWASIVTGGLEASGQLKAPTADMPKGQGFSVGGNSLSYNASTSLLKAAATGDPVDAFMGVYGNGLIENAVGSSEVLQGSIDALGMSPDAFASAVSKAATKIAQGEDLDDSLIAGLGTYIKEGGGLGTPDLGSGDGGMFDGLLEAGREFDDAVLQPIKELVEGVAGSVVDGLGEVGSAIVGVGSQVNKDVVKPAIDVVQDVAEEVVEVGSQINKDYVKPSVDVIEDVANTVVEAGSEAHKTVTQPIFRAIDDAGSQFDDAALQPIKDVVESVASQVGKAGSEFDDAVLQPTKDFLEGLGSGLEDAIKAGGRVFDDVVLQPLKALLEGLFGIVSPVAETLLGGLVGGAVAPQSSRSATRTTDELFSSMIELGSTQERLEFEDFDSDPFGDTTQGYNL